MMPDLHTGLRHLACAHMQPRLYLHVFTAVCTAKAFHRSSVSNQHVPAPEGGACMCTQGYMQGWSTERRQAMQAKQGWPSIFVDLRVVDDSGKELPRDGKKSGELQAKGAHVVHTYLKVRTSSFVLAYSCIIYVPHVPKMLQVA